MLQSQLFTKTRREAPKDEVAKNAQLLIRAGFVQKEVAGVYDYLPLGLRTLEKINRLIRSEMQKLNATEINMSALQNPDLWQKTGRWDDKSVDVWFKTRLKNESELGLGFTHEEPITSLLKEHIKSYRDLPRAVYQIQTKFRNETRTKSGLIRGREFLMKDLYSFHATRVDQEEFYGKVSKVYQDIFKAVGLGERTYLTFASGGAFSKYSHEFQTLSEAGEDTIYLASDKEIAVNLEVATPEVLNELGLEKEELVPHKSIEVGNIFTLGTRFSSAIGLNYLDSEGKSQPVWMGSYGLGPSRLLGTVAEVLSDEDGLVWPKSIAPFMVYLIVLNSRDEKVMRSARTLYETLEKLGVETLFDDRGLKAGEHFADSDLIGLPYRVVVSEKTLAEEKYELKIRSNGEVNLLDEKALIKLLQN
ncbi:prolyl-tRNA synthetase [Candidatus Nomurabacteria bacterium]|nr:prolyl-tRNA synthetase [Candidatus Nomurabacteria bacterium]